MVESCASLSTSHTGLVPSPLHCPSAFGVGPCEHVRMRVRPDRVERLVEDIGRALEGTQLPTAAVASMCGQLQFTLVWGFCRFGKGVLQPLTARRSGAMGGVLLGTWSATRSAFCVLYVLGNENF